MWLLSATGLVMVWLGRWPPTARRFLTGLLLASFLAVSPGFYFRPHYFILMLPVAGLLVGVAVASTDRMLQRILSASTARVLAPLVFVAALTAYVIHDRAYLVSMPLREITRTRYGNNPFIEAVDIARYVKEHTSPDDRIAVLGSEPEIYFYANRKSATGYIYVYPLMEQQKYSQEMQDEMIKEITKAHPKYALYVAVPSSWLAQKNTKEKIVRWSEAYLNQCYSPVGN